MHILTNFRELNKVMKRKPYPLPKISDLLQKLQGFKYATAIDLSMGYYHVRLDEESSKLCTTILPWGKYRYLRLPMGIKNSPDIFQQLINDVLGDIKNVWAYLDDILITASGSYEGRSSGKPRQSPPLSPWHWLCRQCLQIPFCSRCHRVSWLLDHSRRYPTTAKESGSDTMIDGSKNKTSTKTFLRHGQLLLRHVATAQPSYGPTVRISIKQDQVHLERRTTKSLW